LILASCANVARAENWPGWRGPDNNGICKETNLPVEWSETKNIAWKLALPALTTPAGSGCTPVVWGDRIFITSRDGKDIVVMCLSTSGKEIWKRTMGATGRMNFKKDETDDASNSCSTDGKHVYAFNGCGDFACYDFDGKEIWKFNAVERYGKFRTNHGMHTTPLLHGDRLYLTLLHAFAHWVIAIDKATGKDIWKVPRWTDAKGENPEAYTCPVVWNNDKETCLVVGGSDYVTGHSMEDGKEIWRLLGNPKRKAAWRIIPSPVASPDLLVVFTGREPEGPIWGLKPGAKGDLAPDGPFVQWQHPKGAPDVPTPLIHDGLVYLSRAHGYGELTCVEAKTGKEHYREVLHEVKYRSSPVISDGKIYVTSHNGYCTVVKTGVKFEKLADNKLADKFTASPAISNGRIYLRGWQNLYCIEAKSQ
jgi:outer membrane protein assembly factor BamB